MSTEHLVGVVGQLKMKLLSSTFGKNIRATSLRLVTFVNVRSSSISSPYYHLLTLLGNLLMKVHYTK